MKQMDISALDRKAPLNHYFKLSSKCSQIIIDKPFFSRGIAVGFHNKNVHNLRDLLNISINELLMIRNIGPIRTKEILCFLDDIHTHKVDLDTLIRFQNSAINYDVLSHSDEVFNGHFNKLSKKSRQIYAEAYDMLGKDFVKLIQNNPHEMRSLQHSLLGFRNKQKIYSKRRILLIKVIENIPNQAIDNGLLNYISIYTDNSNTIDSLKAALEDISDLKSDNFIFNTAQSPNFSKIYKYLLWCAKLKIDFIQKEENMYYYENNIIYEKDDLVTLDLFDEYISYLSELCDCGDSCFCGEKAFCYINVNGQEIKLCEKHKEKLDEFLFETIF